MTDKQSYWDNQPDVYQYPDCSVLKNIPEIKNEQELASFEKLAVANRLEEAHQFALNKPIKFNLWQNIHRILFQDIFDWAGQIRTVQMCKNNSIFAYPENIEREGNQLFTKLNNESDLKNLSKLQFYNRLTYYFSELNALHPFRDGNGRTERLLFEIIIARAGYDVIWNIVSPDEYLQAVIDGYYHRFDKLTIIFKKIIVDPV
jgi:cell filamentation protein